MMIPAEDAFAQIYPRLDPELILNAYATWATDSDFERAVTEVAEQVRADGTIEMPPAGDSPDRQLALFATARGIDRAFAAIHPIHGARRVPRALASVRTRRTTTGRYNVDADRGAVVPRLASPDRDTLDPDRLDLLFPTLLYVAPATARKVDHQPVRASLTVSRELRAVGLSVATAPFLEDPAELDFTYPERSGRHYYRVELPDQPSVRARTQAMAPELAASGGHMAFLPELTNAGWLQTLWPSVLAAAVAAGGSALRWAVMGTGDLDGADHPSDPVNETRLFDVATGEVLLRQRKVHRFDLESYMIAGNYPLPGAPTGVKLREDIHRGSRLVIAEMGAVRLAILICEDLARHEALLGVAYEFGVSHVLAPVFSKPTKPNRWEQNSGGSFAAAAGTTVVVANSLVLGRLNGGKGELNVSLALGPVFPSAHAKAGRATDLAVYLLRDGRAPERSS